MQSDEPTQIRKILLFTANPKDTARLRLDEEHRRIKDSLKRSDRRDQFEIHVEPAVTIRHIRRALLEQKPEIVEFCGHGAGPDGIVCEDDLGQMKLIPTAALANLFKLNSHVKCVVLNACFAEIQANEIVRHIDFVVGMRRSISDDAALSFSEGFHDAYFADKEIPQCYEWGINTMQLESIPEDLTPILKMRVPVKKTVKARPKKLPEASINSSEKKPTKVPLSLEEPVSGNPDPSTSTPQPPVAEKQPLLRRIPKRAWWSLLIPVFLCLIFIGARKQDDIAGYYIQDSDQKSTNAAGKTSDKIRRDEVSTTLNVFFDSTTGKWRAIETTFWKYYYATDINHLDKRTFIGASKAEVEYEEYGRRGGKIQMFGRPGKGQSWLQVEPLSGDQKLIDEITAAVNTESNYLRSYFTNGVWTEWSVDESGNLIKEKWYKDQLEKRDQGQPGKIENFTRQY